MGSFAGTGGVGPGSAVGAGTAEDDIMAAVLEASRRDVMAGAGVTGDATAFGANSCVAHAGPGPVGAGEARGNPHYAAASAADADVCMEDEQMDPELQRALAESLLGACGAEHPPRHE